MRGKLILGFVVAFGVAAGVVAQAEEAPRAVAQGLGLVALSAADHHRQAAQLRVAQQFDGRVERVHVEVGDQARRVARAVHPYSIASAVRAGKGRLRPG